MKTHNQTPRAVGRPVTFVVAPEGTLGRRLHSARVARGETVGAVASRIGVHSGKIGRWESGEVQPGARHLAALARALDVSADWLLGLSPRGGPRKLARAPTAASPTR